MHGKKSVIKTINAGSIHFSALSPEGWYSKCWPNVGLTWTLKWNGANVNVSNHTFCFLLWQNVHCEKGLFFFYVSLMRQTWGCARLEFIFQCLCPVINTILEIRVKEEEYFFYRHWFLKKSFYIVNCKGPGESKYGCSFSRTVFLNSFRKKKSTLPSSRFQTASTLKMKALKVAAKKPLQ